MYKYILSLDLEMIDVQVPIIGHVFCDLVHDTYITYSCSTSRLFMPI